MRLLATFAPATETWTCRPTDDDTHVPNRTRMRVILRSALAWADGYGDALLTEDGGDL